MVVGWERGKVIFALVGFVTPSRTTFSHIYKDTKAPCGLSFSQSCIEDFVLMVRYDYPV